MKNLGIWVDSSKAICVYDRDGKPYVSTIDSEIESRERYEGESPQQGRFGNQFLDDENKKELRAKEQMKRYIKAIEEEIKVAEKVVILGPAQMKFELKKALEKDTQYAKKIKGIETMGKLTENQLVSWVLNYFGEPIPNRKDRKYEYSA